MTHPHFDEAFALHTSETVDHHLRAAADHLRNVWRALSECRDNGQIQYVQPGSVLYQNLADAGVFGPAMQVATLSAFIDEHLMRNVRIEDVSRAAA